MRRLKNLLPASAFNALSALGGGLQEIRLRADKPITVLYKGKKYFLSENGLTLKRNSAIIVSVSDVRSAFLNACQHSVHSFAGQLADGFLSPDGGIRIGVGGTAVTEGSKVVSFKDISSLNIRIPSEIKNCSLPVAKYLLSPIRNVLVVSGPGGGKTTFLRDLIYQTSLLRNPPNVLVADERNEISGTEGGAARFDLGDFCDCVCMADKIFAFASGVRTMTPDVLGMYPKKCDEERVSAFEAEHEDDLLVDPAERDDYMYELFGSDLKVALVTEDWISEVPEGTMTSGFGIGPGDIRSRIDMMDWMIYAMGEIAYIFNPPAIKRIRPLSTRIRYGVKEELMDLVSLRGIGRARARALFDRGIRTKAEVAASDVSVLSTVPGIGRGMAEAMLRQAGKSAEPVGYTSPSEEEALIDEMAAAYGEAGETDSSPEPVVEEKKEEGKGEAGPRQASLFDF